MRPARVARFMPQQGDRGEGHASSFGGHRGGGVGGADKGGGAPSGRPLLSTDRSFREPGIGHSAQQRVVNQPGTTSFQLAPAPGPLQVPVRPPPVPQNVARQHHDPKATHAAPRAPAKSFKPPRFPQGASKWDLFEGLNIQFGSIDINALPRCPSSSLAPPNLNEEKHNQVLLDRPLQQHLQPRWKPQQLAQLSQQVTQQPQQQQARKGAIASGQLNSVNPYVQSMPGVQMSVPFDHQPLPTGSTAVAPYRIWPPPQCHRDTMVRYLVETLVAPNLLTNNYGRVPRPRAQSIAAMIEAEAFAAVDSSVGDLSIYYLHGVEALKMYPAKICECLRNLLDSRYANAEEAEGSAPGAAPASAVVAPLATHDDAAAVPAEGTALAAALTSADVAPQAAALVSMLAAEGGALVARRGRKPSTRAASASVKATPLAAHDDEVAVLAKGSAPAATLVSADVSPRAASPVSVLAAEGGAPVARRERKPNSRVFGSQWTA